MSLPTPITRKESYLAAIAGEEVQVPEKPITREEAYLDAIVKGGGGGGTIDPTPTEGSTNAVSSGGTYTSLQGKLDTSSVGTASGVAELDANGKVPSSQLPSFVDDVVEGYYDSETDRFYEESTFEHVIDPVGGKSWVDIPANKSYRWTGSVYVRVDEGVQLGETSNSAFRGDWGKTLKDTMGTGTLDTTAQTVIPAINELNTGKANTSDITDAINALDVSSVGGTGKYISAISETDGKISATADTMDEAPTEDSNKPVKSGGIFDAINNSVSLKSATGNPITLTDAANANAEALSMAIEPIQGGSGEPSPENVRPISGLTEGNVTRTGKNLVNPETLQSGFYNTSGYNAGDSYKTSAPIKVEVGKTYKGTMFVNNLSDSYDLVYTTFSADDIIKAKRQVVGGTITILEGESYVRVRNYSDQQSYILNNDFAYQLEEGSTATPFEPYNGTTATITFGQTVYGGTVDFKTGQVTVTHGYTTVGDMTWSYESANTRFGAVLSDMKYAESMTALPPLKCSAYKPLDATTFNTGVNNAIRGNDGGAKSVWIRDTRYTDAATFKSAMSGVQLCYELATPTTLTLTPAELELLKGNNTITANGAEISLEYYPDNAIGALAGRVDDVQEQIAVPKYNSSTETEYFEGGSAFSGNIDSTPTAGSNNAVASGGVKTYVDSAAATKRSLTASSSIIGNGVNIPNATSTNPYITPHEGFVRFDGPSCLCINDYRIMKSSANGDIKGMWLPKGVSIYFTDGTPPIAQWFNCSNE